MARIRFGNRTIVLPGNRIARIALGVGLILVGLVGWLLPVIPGFAMVPLGLIVLSVDFPIVRRWRRRATVWLVLKWERLHRWVRRRWGFNLFGLPRSPRRRRRKTPGTDLPHPRQVL